MKKRQEMKVTKKLRCLYLDTFSHSSVSQQLEQNQKHEHNIRAFDAQQQKHVG